MKNLILFIVIFLLFPAFALGYTDVNMSGTMLIDVTPQNPAPGETVTLKVTSYRIDLNRSNITWSSNGAPFKTGIGERTVKVKVGPAGTETKINIVARTTDGEMQEKVVAFLPAGIDLLWQARTSVPPFYRGRALPTAGSRVSIIAEPDFIDKAGKKISEEKLVYEWSRNGNKLGEESGYGKYYLEIDDLSGFSNELVGVTATDMSGMLVAEKTLSLPTLSPRLAIYEEDPLLGTKFEKALKNAFDMVAQELTLRGEAYFYPLTGTSPRWVVNNEKTVTEGAFPNLLTLRQPGNQAGTADVAFAADNTGMTGSALPVALTVRFGAGQIKF